MRPTIEDILAAVATMGSGLVKYFPADDLAREVIVRELERFVPTQEALLWLTETYVRRVGEWHSMKELRAVLCTFCTPLDGIHVNSSLPGFTPTDIAVAGEQAYFEREAEKSAKAIQEGRRQLAAPEDPEFEAKWNRENEEIQKRISDAAIERSIDKSKKRIPYRAPEWLENL